MRTSPFKFGDSLSRLLFFLQLVRIMHWAGFVTAALGDSLSPFPTRGGQAS